MYDDWGYDARGTSQLSAIFDDYLAGRSFGWLELDPPLQVYESATRHRQFQLIAVYVHHSPSIFIVDKEIFSKLIFRDIHLS